MKNVSALTAANQTLFPTWNEVWSVNEGNRPFIDRLGSLWERRSRGNQTVGRAVKGVDKASVANALSAIEAALAAEHIPDPSAVAGWRTDLDLPLRLERWNRWLHLEHALKIASASGDLLSVALILRSLGEEVIRLLVLDYKVQSRHLTFSSNDDATISWMAGALIASEPLIRSTGDAIKKDGSRYFDLAAGIKARSSVRDVLLKLNDYAHPNFGSHVLALFPEESAASTSILESACELYEAFFALSWSEQPASVNGNVLDTPYVTSLPKISWRMENRTFRDIDSDLQRKQGSSSSEFHNFLTWLKVSDSRLIELFDVADEEGEESVLDYVVALYRRLPAYSSFGNEQVRRMVRSSGAADKLPVINRGAGLLAKWAVARYADHLLSNITAHDPDVSIGGTGWLRFIAYCLHLSSSITELKIEFFLAQAALQIANRNELGAAICARSLVEHMAAQEWVVSRIEKNWEEIKKRIQQGKLSESHLEKIDKDLALFLTGTKFTSESPREWNDSWSSGRKGILQVLTLVEDMAPGHKLSYDFFSGVIHGRLTRGLELAEYMAKSSRTSGSLFVALSNANKVCAPFQEHNRVTRSALMSFRFTHLADSISGREGDVRMLEKATFAIPKLKPKLHYIGKGTVDDPYRFREGILYHEAFGVLCAQLGLNPDARQPSVIKGGILDMVKINGHVTYFLHPHDVMERQWQDL